MSVLDLRQLHRLHLIDLAILQVRQRAAALDPGRKIQAEIAALEAETEGPASLRSLNSEISDLELKVKSLDEKTKKFHRELYGGSTVNAKEAANLEKELEMLAKHKEELETREMELLELLPGAKSASEEHQAKLDEKKAELKEHQKKAMELKTKLEATFKEATARRPEALATVSKDLLVRYEAVRQKQGGIGMADVVKGNCGQCGTHLPIKTVELAKEGKVVSCESCNRILYVTEGLI